MTLLLTVDAVAWRDHVDRVARHTPGLIPVVKGNGYGFGRRPLGEIAATLADTVAVGTIHELGDVPAGVTALVLTPTRRPPEDPTPIMTVGARAHVDALAGWPGRVVVKLASSMGRFGVAADELGELTRHIRRTGLDIAAFGLHLPLAGGDDRRADEIGRWLELLDVDDELWVSHVCVDGYAALLDAWPERHLRIRVGTALWHGDKAPLHLGADVLDVHPVRGGATVGYRLVTVPGDGWVVVVGAGTAHGVQPLPDGRSPFHFARRRLTLLESPHMHTSMAFVGAGEPRPQVGEVVDVQRPLTMVAVDEVVWR